MKQPLVTVIIPHLNQPEFLQRCLESITVQSYDPNLVDIIVVDNGSKELPNAICGMFKQVKLLSEATPGPGPARNKGVAAAKTELLAFIDADCLADVNWLGALTQALQRPDTDIIGGDVRIAYEDPNNLTALEAYETVFAYRQKEYIEKKGFSGTGNLATKKAVIKKIGPFRGIEVAEDRDGGNRAQKLGFKIKFIPNMIVRHPARKTFGELTDKWNRQMSHDFEEIPMSPSRKLRWLARATMVAISPLVDFQKVIWSNQLHSPADRLKACGVLIKIRLYRANRMFGILLRNQNQESAKLWNRK